MNTVQVNQVIVVKADDEQEHRLRIYFDAGRGGVVMFESLPEFSKREADFRAMQISNINGVGRDELPTHQYQIPYPRVEKGRH